MSKPEIIIPSLNEGFHNLNPEKTVKRIEKEGSYKDLSTICIVPSPNGMLSVRFVQSFKGMMTPMNQKFLPIFVSNMEVGEAYSQTIEAILQNPDLSNFKYILTVEWDNLMPPDGLLKLYEDMDKFDVIGGLYFTKGAGGQPMCYGRVDQFPVNFIPFLPQQESVQPCRGVGMGFTLFKTEIFKNPNLPRPFFKTIQEYTPGQGVRAYTQDLSFSENAGKLGYKFAVNSKVKVGHLDVESGFVW